MPNHVEILFNGYSKIPSSANENWVMANCSCVLITGNCNVIIDTMTPWDKDKILKSLDVRNINPNDINYVVCTHGHSDHVGNNNLFLNAKHIVGYCISFKDKYFLHPFEKG